MPAPNGASPSPAFPRGRSKKKNTLGGVFFLLWPRAGAQRGFSFPCLSPGPQQKKKHPGWCFFFLLWPRAGTGLLLPCLSPGPEQKKNTLGGVFFFFLLWPRAGAQRGFSFPCLSPGPQQKKTHPGWCFFFLLWPRVGTGLLLPLPFPGAGAKKKHPGWCFFFCSGPAERSRRPTERNKKKKHFAHPGPTAKNFLETNDPGHEQKGATTKKKTPWPVLELRGLWPGVSLTSYTKIRQVDQSWGPCSFRV